MILALLLAAAAPAAPVERVYESPREPSPQGTVDELVFREWKRLGIQPARLCSDAVFLRRVFLDLTGTLPTAQESVEFLRDREPAKRRALIDRLLEREEFAEYQAMKWGDVLRVKAEFPINLWPMAAQAYHGWIRAAWRENKPYDQFARELLTSSGSNFRTPAVNFYRAVESRTPEALARAAALAFLGARAEKWPKERLEGMTAFFSAVGYKPTKEWKEEIVYFDPGKAASTSAVLPDGSTVRLKAGEDPRAAFAAWLTAAGNVWFARSAANRIWSWLLGRGIVHEPDDIREDNPPVNAPLLDYLGRELAGARFDLKHLYRLILNSHTYQLSPVPRSRHELASAHFAYYPLRRLEAEVLADALCQITGTAERYSSAIPEPYTVMPEGQRSVSLPDGSISSPFLELFGRPPRDTGRESERNNGLSAAQRLHMLNSSHVQQKLQNSGRLQFLFRNSKTPQATVNGLYLMILSRIPTPEEMETASAAMSTGPRGREAVIDLAWALINSTEFLYRH